MSIINNLDPEIYLGKYHSILMGYSLNEFNRKRVSSGGLVTELVLYLLENKIINGALLSKCEIINGKLVAKSIIAKTKEDVLDCRSSIYIDTPVINSIKEISKFEGVIAVVGLPCQLRAIDLMTKKNPVLKSKIKFKFGLFCSGVSKDKMIYDIFKKNNIDLSEVTKFYFRQGHWRGYSEVHSIGSQINTFSYKFNQSTYKNAYFDTLPRCHSCQDHFAYNSDASFGDVWLSEMKKNSIKHTAILIKNKKINNYLSIMDQKKIVKIFPLSEKKLINSQKRPLIFKFHAALARKKIGELFNHVYKSKLLPTSNWNHYIVSFLIILNVKISQNIRMRKILYKLPNKLVFLYMGLIRVLLSF